MAVDELAYAQIYNANRSIINTVCFVNMIFYALLVVALKIGVGKYAYSKWNQNCKTVWVHYINLSES